MAITINPSTSIVEAAAMARKLGRRLRGAIAGGEFRVVLGENMGDEAAPQPYPCANTGKCGHYTAESDPGCSGCDNKG